jgi:predicted secreted Zn-dependent protease
MPQESRKKLYDAVSTKFDIGSFDEFNKKMDDSSSRKKFYEAVSTDFDLGDFNTFETKISLKKKAQSVASATGGVGSQLGLEPSQSYKPGVQRYKPGVNQYVSQPAPVSPVIRNKAQAPQVVAQAQKEQPFKYDKNSFSKMIKAMQEYQQGETKNIQDFADPRLNETWKQIKDKQASNYNDPIGDFSKFVIQELSDLVPQRISNAWNKGLLQGEQANIVNLGFEKITNEDANRLARIEQELATYTPSKEEQKFAEGGFSWVINNPIDGAKFIGETILNSLASQIKASTRSIPQGVAVGAAAGAPIGGVGAIPGAFAGATAGTIMAGLNIETSQKILQSIKDAGFDLKNPEDIKNAFSDRDMIEKFRISGLKRGVPIAIIDVFTAGVAGKVAKGGSTLARSAGRKVAGLGVEAVGGSTGEFAAQVAAGEKIDPNTIALEGIAEVGAGAPTLVTSTAYQGALERKNTSSSDKNIALQITANKVAGDEDAKNHLNKLLNEGTIDEAGFEDGINVIEQSKVSNSRIPDNIVGESRAESIVLINEKTNLQNQIKGLEDKKNAVDVVYHPDINKQIEVLTNEIKNLDNKLIKVQEQKNAIQEPSTTSQVPSVTEGGENIQEGGEGVGQGIEGTQAPQAISKEEVAPLNVYFDKTLEGKNKWVIDIQDEDLRNQYEEDGEDVLWRTKGEAVQAFNDWLKSKQETPQKISPEEVSRLREQEQAEYAAMDNPNDAVKRKEIYDRYDKPITEAIREAKQEDVSEDVIPETVAEPAKQEATKVNKEIEILESNLLSEEIAFENAQEEIDNLKYELKEEKARIKQAIADVRKSNLSRADKEDKIEDLKYELEDFIDTHDSLVENNKEDMLDAKKEIAKINKKLKKMAEAPAQAEPTKTAGVSATNKSQLADLKSRVTDAVKAGVVQTAERAINTLKSILPGFDIVIHEDEGSYNETVSSVGGQTNTRGNFSYSVNADGTYSGRIDINLNKANARTVAHEVAHAVLLKSFGENPKLFKTFRDKISKVLNSSRNAELIKFSNLYEGDVQAEEYLAELTAILEQQQDKLSPNVLQQIAAYINDLVSKLTNGAIKPFENVKDTKDIIDFFNAVSGAIREGAEISESDIKAIQEGASINIGSPTTINKSQKGEAIEFPDKPLPLSFVTSKDKVDIRALINEIVDKKQKVWFWMADQLGRGDYYDAVIDGKHYLDAGPSFALDPKNREKGVLWASGLKEKTLQNKINQSDYIFFISGSPQAAKLFNKRVLDLFSERINKTSSYSKFKEAINKFNGDTVNYNVIKDTLNRFKSFDEIKNNKDGTIRKYFLRSIGEVNELKTMKSGSLKELLNNFNALIDYDDLRDGFYKENGFNQNDIMLVGKPTGLGGKAPHSTYENAIMGEVIGVPDIRINSWDIMPESLKEEYSKGFEFIDKKTGKEKVRGDVSLTAKSKVIYAETGKVREIEGQLPVSKSQQIDEELSKASGTTQVATTTGSYVKAADILKKLDTKGRVLDYGAGYGLGTDAMSKVLGKPVESYEINSERWKGKKPVTYKKSADIDGKFDAIVSLNVLNVVPRDKRDFIVQDIYNHLEDGGKAVISSRKFKGDIDSAKNFELGPEDKSYIVKRPKDGKLIDVYQKGFDGNELVDYIKEILGNKVDVKKDNSFGATGVVIEKLPVSKSQKIQEEDNREALRVAGLPYLENTLEVLSAKFGMPYKVVYDEDIIETGYIDYDNYGEPTIIINTANATNDTPLIQYGNIFINQIKNTNKNLFSGLVKQVLNTKEGQAELEFAKERYSNDDYEDQVQQAIVSLLAKYAKNQFDPKTGIHKAIKKVWDTILDFLSKSFNVNINEIPASTTMEQLAKILSNPNISVNKTPYSETIKEEIVEDSKRALKDREREYSDIQQIPNPSLFEFGNRRIIANKKQFEEFYNTIKEIVETLKNYKNSQLLVDLTNIKSQISSTEARESFRYDRYPLFSSLLKFIHRDPEVALWSINYAIENGENIQAFFDREFVVLDEDLDSIVYKVANGYRIGKNIGIEPIPSYNVYSSLFNSVDEVKAKLENDIESLSKAIENPELGADYYRRNFIIPVGDDTYTIRGNYRDGNIDITFSSEKYGMADANEGLFFKILPKVIDAISYMYSDVDYNTISFTPVSSDKTTKGSDLRLKGYNIFAKRLFGEFSLLAEYENTRIIPIPEIFKNRPLVEERTYSKSQKVEGEEQAPKKGGPLARIKQAIEKSRAGKTSVGAPKKPLEFEEAEIIPSEKGKANLFRSLNAPARSLNKLKQASEGAGSFFNKVKRAAIDTKYDIAKALTRSKTPIGDIARAAMRNAKGYTGASSLVIKLVNSQIFDKLSFNPNVKMKLIDENGKLVDTVWSERQLFDAFLDANRIINIDARIRDKFSELVVLSRELKNGIKNESLTKEEQDELVNQISQLKDYLLRRKALDVKGPEGQVQMIGYQDPDFVYTDKLINLLKEDYAPIQYTHTDGKTQADAEEILSEMKAQLPDLYKTFDKMSSDYYDTFRDLLDENLKNGLITKEVYDELWSYNYIPTKFIQHFIESELSIDNPSKAKKLSASLKNLTGGSEEDVITNYQYIMELYAHATYRRIFDNRAAVKLAQALGKIDPNRFGKDSKFFIQRPNGKDKKGNPTYSDPEKGYDYIKFMVDGVENRIIAPKQFVDIWYDSEFQSSPWLDSTVNFFSKLTLVEFIKGVFTKYSPVFGITQILLDAPQALISTKAYPDFFLGSVLLAKDYATVAKDVLSIVRNGKPTKLFVEAVQAGVFSDFLSTENDLIRGESFTNYDGTDNVKNKVKYLIGRVNRGVDKTLKTIAKVNEAVEYSTRLAVYYRMKQNLTAKFKKDNNGAEPTGQDLENIQLLSAEQARNVVDFSVGGGVTKQANRLFAYLNSTIQVFVSAARGLKNNPWKAGLMMLEIGAAGAALLAYSLGDLGGEDDEEKKKRYKEYKKLSTYEKESYFLRWTGNPDRPFLRIPKPPLFKGLINIFEQAYLNASRGEDFNQEKMWSAFQRDVPFGNPLAELTRNPLINAMFKYFNNYDQFRKQNIVKDEEKILDYAETKGTTELYKKIGKASKDIGLKEGVSPKRLQEAVRSFTGDPTKNTWASLFDMGSKGSVALATGDTKELDEMFTGNPISDAFKNLGFEAKLFTKPIDYDASFAEELKEDEKVEYTKNYVIRGDVNEIRNNSNDLRSAVKSIYEYLKPKVESKEIDAEYANRVIKNQFKLFGLKDAPEFYDDVAYAKDNDIKAKMLNYYLSDMSNQEAGKVMKDMISKGLLSEEAFLKTINLRASKNK